MSPQIENIKHPVLREFAEKTQHMSKGDFGMTIYGGVDLTAYAEMIVKECARIADEQWIDNSDEECSRSSSTRIKEHFGINE